MKLGNCLVGFMVTSAVFLVSENPIQAAVTAGGSFPEAQVMRIVGGEKVPVARQGKVTMVNLWATWCEACKVEIAEMEKALLPVKGKDGSKPDLMFVSLDKEPEKAREWFRKNTKATEAMMDNLYSDPSFEIAEKLEADSFPMTVVIGKDGKILHVERGFKEGAEGSAQVRKVAELMEGAL